MVFARDNHFTERLADFCVQQAPAEVDLQPALQNCPTVAVVFPMYLAAAAIESRSTCQKRGQDQPGAGGK